MRSARVLCAQSAPLAFQSAVADIVFAPQSFIAAALGGADLSWLLGFPVSMLSYWLLAMRLEGVPLAAAIPTLAAGWKMRPE